MGRPIDVMVIDDNSALAEAIAESLKLNFNISAKAYTLPEEVVGDLRKSLPLAILFRPAQLTPDENNFLLSHLKTNNLLDKLAFYSIMPPEQRLPREGNIAREFRNVPYLYFGLRDVNNLKSEFYTFVELKLNNPKPA